MNNTISYYNKNAADFIRETKEVDMSALYQRFLPQLPKGGAILDAGCGSCRDSLHFHQLGYKVTAFDASESMVSKAPKELQGKVEQSSFLEFCSTELYDGIWACASLLHVPHCQLTEVLERLSNLLKPGGIFYLSFKYGEGERQHNGRSFTDMNEQGLQQLIEPLQALSLSESWQTGDARPGREHEKWLNALLCKNGFYPGSF